MRIQSLQLQNFKRFTDLKIEGIPDSAKLVLLIGANGSGKSSVFDALNRFSAGVGSGGSLGLGMVNHDYYRKSGNKSYSGKISLWCGHVEENAQALLAAYPLQLASPQSLPPFGPECCLVEMLSTGLCRYLVLGFWLVGTTGRAVRPVVVERLERKQVGVVNDAHEQSRIPVRNYLVKPEK